MPWRERFFVALKRTRKFMAVVFVLAVLSLPLVTAFAFDAPGQTWISVIWALSVFYGIYIFVPWFIVSFLWNLLRGR